METFSGHGGKADRGLSALLFLNASMNTLAAYGTLNSSPWTAESFGGDPQKARACREYVWHAISVSSFYGLASAAIGESWWPILGTVIADVYLYYLYNRALNRAAERGSETWSD